MTVEQGDHAVVQKIGCRDRCLAIIELGERNLGIGVDERLLVDAPDPLQIADIERVLGAAVARMLALELAMGLLLGLGLFQRDELGLGQDQAFLGALGLQRFEPLVHGLEVMTPAGAHQHTRLRNSLATRTWPKAGCSMATATTASSISCATRFFSTGFLRLISCNASSPALS